MRTAFLTAIPNEERVAFPTLVEDNFLDRVVSHIKGIELKAYRGEGFIVWADPGRVLDLAGVQTGIAPGLGALLGEPRDVDKLAELTSDPMEYSWLMFRDVPMVLFIGSVVVTGELVGEDLEDLPRHMDADWFNDQVCILHAEKEPRVVDKGGEGEFFVTSMKQAPDARFRSVL